MIEKHWLLQILKLIFRSIIIHSIHISYRFGLTFNETCEELEQMFQDPEIQSLFVCSDLDNIIY